MCYWSTAHPEARNARVGERLTTKRFGHTIGLVSADETDQPVVCVLTGMRLRFPNIPSEFGKNCHIRDGMASTFTQDPGDKRHDVLQFENGVEIQLMDFPERIEVVVVSGVPVPKTMPPAREPRRNPAEELVGVC